MKIALINDISGFGNCSLTAGISVLSVMKHETFALPTAVLSNQTAFESYAMQDLTDKTREFLQKWEEIGEKIDCVYAGFSPSKQTPNLTLELAKKHNAFFVLDPVLGDDGEFYKCFDNSFISVYQQVVKHADLTTPNLTELCFLTNTNYNEVINSDNVANRVADLIPLLGCKNVVVTGIMQNGYYVNVCNFNGATYVCKTKALERSYSGTGDLFTSVLTGSLLSGLSPKTSVKKASKFIYKCIKESIKQGYKTPHGVLYQKFLKWL